MSAVVKRSPLTVLLRPVEGRHGALARLVTGFRGSGAYRQAIKVFESLVKLRPDHARYASVLASLYNDLGARLWRAGKTEQAHSACRRAFAIQQKLASERPTRRHANQYARIKHNLAIILAERRASV